VAEDSRDDLSGHQRDYQTQGNRKSTRISVGIYRKQPILPVLMGVAATHP
jgi:hypothetical protein